MSRGSNAEAASERAVHQIVSKAHSIWNEMKKDTDTNTVIDTSTVKSNTDNNSNSDKYLLEGCLWNNHGLTYIMKQEPTEAMS